MCYQNKNVLFWAIISCVFFAQYDKVDKRIVYESSRDEHNLPDKSDDDEDDTVYEDCNAYMLQPKSKKTFVDENVDNAISVVKKEQDTCADLDNTLNDNDLDDDVVVEDIIDGSTFDINAQSKADNKKNRISKNTDIKKNSSDMI